MTQQQLSFAIIFLKIANIARGFLLTINLIPTPSSIVSIKRMNRMFQIRMGVHVPIYITCLGYGWRRQGYMIVNGMVLFHFVTVNVWKAGQRLERIQVGMDIIVFQVQNSRV
jgi:hypothetical protein